MAASVLFRRYEIDLICGKVMRKDMNSKIRLLLCVLLAALLVSLTGLTFSSVQENSLYEAGKWKRQ